MYDIGKQLELPELPWFLLGTIGFITLYALHRQFNRKKLKQPCLPHRDQVHLACLPSRSVYESYFFDCFICIN